MAKINKKNVYGDDPNISMQDYLLGSNSNTPGLNKKTQNYPLQLIADLFLPYFQQFIGGNLVVKPTQTGTTYTLGIDDANSLIPFSNTGNKNIYIPNSSTSNIPIGKPIILSKIDGDGNTTLTVVPDPDITIYAPTGLVLKGQTQLKLIKIDEDVWLADANIFYGLNNNIIRTKYGISCELLVAGYGGIFLENGLRDPSDTIQFLIDTGYSAWKSNKLLKYTSGVSPNGTLDLINVGFVANRQVIGNTYATIAPTTTHAVTGANLTADKIWTLPSGLPAGKKVYVSDEHKTCFANGFKVIIKAISGKTLNSITDGEVWLGYPGHELVFTSDGNNNFSYSPDSNKECIIFASGCDPVSGLSDLVIKKNTTTTNFDLTVDFVKESGPAGEYAAPNYDENKHFVSAVYFNDVSQMGVIGGNKSGILANINSRIATSMYGTPFDNDSPWPIWITIREI